MNIIAIDDEMLALDEMESAIREVVPGCTVSGFSRSDTALEYAGQNHVDVVFLDVEMPGMDGLELARRLKDINPKVNIIFVTGYAQYSLPAHSLRVSGFLVKPFTSGDIAKEIENLRVPVHDKTGGRVRVQCFGNFEVFVDGKPLYFPRSKAKEVFAYLVYKKGASCTVKELAAALLNDKQDGNRQIQTYIRTMIKAFESCSAKDIIIKEYNKLSVDTSKIDCDYYHCLDGDMEAERTYLGEYMSAYEWAEHIAGYLDRRLKTSS